MSPSGIFRRHFRTVTVIGLLVVYSVGISFALPPATKYQPGSTLDPSCAPGSSNCSVQILPDQTSAGGGVLTTDGNTTSWTKILTNLTLITPTIASITNGAATLSLPTTSDTLVGRTTTDTLTNKSLSGSTNTFTNIPNAALSNSTITINGQPTALGSSATITTTGTLNRISITNGATLTPTIDIASTYIGQSSLTTVGALSSGSIVSGFGNINVGGNSITADNISIGNSGTSAFVMPLGGAGTPKARLAGYDLINQIGFTNNYTLSDTQDDATKPSLGFYINTTLDKFTFSRKAAGAVGTLANLVTIDNAGGITAGNVTGNAASFTTGLFNGAVTVTGTSTTVPLAYASGFGYNIGAYNTIVIGPTSGSKTIAFGVDLAANTNGAFTGDGSEYFWRNTGSFKTPNGANNGYNTLITWTNGQVTFPSAIVGSITGTAASETLATVSGRGNTYTGSIGLGVASTPAWGSGIVGISFGQSGQNIHALNDNSIRLASNTYWNGTNWVVANSATLTPSVMLLYAGTNALQLATGTTAAVGSATTISTVFNINSSGTITQGSYNAGAVTSSGVVSGASNFNATTGNTSFQWTNSGNNVAMNANNGIYTLYTGTAAYNPRMTVDASGNVGIGTTTPSQKLTIQGTSYTPTLGLYALPGSGGVAVRNWGLQSNYISYGDFGIMQSTARDGDPIAAGATKFYIDPNGNVGIGTTVPAQTLHVVGNGTNTALFDSGGVTIRRSLISFLDITDNGVSGRSWRLSSDSNSLNGNFSVTDNTAGSVRFSITSSGNVGIGVTNPLQKLDVSGGILRVGSVSSVGGATLIVDNYANGNITTFGTEFSSGGPVIGYGVTPSTAASDSFVSSDPLALARGAITIAGNVTKFFKGTSQTVAVGSPVTMTESMRIDGNGNLGIGTTSPTTKFTVLTGDSGYYASSPTSAPSSMIVGINPEFGIVDTGNATGRTATLRLGTVHSTYYTYGAYVRAVEGAGVDTYSLEFGTSQNNPATTRMAIATNGNVGIGTTSPSGRLHTLVDGAANFTYSSSFGTSPNNILQAQSARGSVAAPAIVQNNDIIWDMRAQGYDGVGYQNAALIRAVIDGTPAAGSMPGSLTFNTTPAGTTSVTERMRINPSGQLLINTANWPTSVVGNAAGRHIIGGVNEPILMLWNEAAAAASNDSVLVLGAKNALGATYIGGGAVKGAIENVTDGSGRLTFFTTNTTSSLIERMRIDSSGNVGIGTTSPGGRLDVVPSADATTDGIIVERPASPTQRGFISYSGGAFQFTAYDNAALGTGQQIIFNQRDSTTQREAMRINAAGNLGIGTSTPTQILSVNNPFTTNGGIYPIVVSQQSGVEMGGLYSVADQVTNPIAAGLVMKVYKQNTGLVEELRISNSGTLRLSAYGAGTLTTDASGNVTASSDERLKDINGSFTRGLIDIRKISPILYHWNTVSGLDTTTQYAGFSAQNIQTSIPEAVNTDPRGYLSLQDRPILAATVNAIKDMDIKVQVIPTETDTSLYAKISDFLRGIAEQGAAIVDKVLSHEVTTDVLCVGRTDNKTCITKDQLDQVLSHMSGASVSAPAPTSTSSAPVPSPSPTPTTPTPSSPTTATPTVTAPTPTLTTASPTV